VQHATTVRGEGEKVTTASRLVMDSIDRKTTIVAIQERTNATVTDEEHIARPVASQDLFDLADNAQLGINRSLPAPNADVGLREKLISHRLKLVRHQESCRRSIVFMHCLAHLHVDIQFCANNLGCLDRLPLPARDDLRCTQEPSGAWYRYRAPSPDLV